MFNYLSPEVSARFRQMIAEDVLAAFNAMSAYTEVFGYDLITNIGGLNTSFKQFDDGVIRKEDHDMTLARSRSAAGSNLDRKTVKYGESDDGRVYTSPTEFFEYRKGDASTHRVAAPAPFDARDLEPTHLQSAAPPAQPASASTNNMNQDPNQLVENCQRALVQLRDASENRTFPTMYQYKTMFAAAAEISRASSIGDVADTLTVKIGKVQEGKAKEGDVKVYAKGQLQNAIDVLAKLLPVLERRAGTKISLTQALIDVSNATDQNIEPAMTAVLNGVDSKVTAMEKDVRDAWKGAKKSATDRLKGKEGFDYYLEAQDVLDEVVRPFLNRFSIR